MANNVANISCGQCIQFFKNVDTNSPAASVIQVIALVSTDTDDALADADTVNAVLLLANTAEATNTGYVRKTATDAGVSTTTDDTGNLQSATLTDITWTSVSAGDNWTHLLLSYDATGADADTVMPPISIHDFVVTPNGGDITADFGTATVTATRA